MTHDLRTPLAAIKAATGSLLDAQITWTEADRRELLGAIDASADRLNRLVGICWTFRGWRRAWRGR